MQQWLHIVPDVVRRRNVEPPKVQADLGITDGHRNSIVFRNLQNWRINDITIASCQIIQINLLKFQQELFVTSQKDILKLVFKN